MTDALRWTVSPMLIPLEGPGLRYYALFVMIGCGAAIVATSHYAERDGVPPKRVSWMMALATFVGFVGAHAAQLLFFEPDALGDAMRWISIGSGLASHGAVAAVILAVWVYARRHGLAAGRCLDAIALGGVILVPFFRLGNLFNSEIVGRPWSGPWAMTFPRHDCPQYYLVPDLSDLVCLDAVPRHPAQIYGVLFGMALMALAFWLRARWGPRLRGGVLFLVVLTAYGAGRFALELTKDYQVLDPATSPLTMGQWLSLPLVLIGAATLMWNRSRLTDPAAS